MNKKVSQTIRPWLTSNLGKHCLAPLTGQSSRALDAAVSIIELYSYDSNPSLIEAFRLVVLRMQDHDRELAYHAIAHVMNWSDREKIWTAASLPPFSNPPRRCVHE